jgi:hypothetical protein
MVTLMEVAVYAAVMANGAPLSCTAEDHIHVYCSNGVAAELGDGSAIRYSNGVTVTRDDSGFPTFSDGTRSWWSAAGWLAFSNGVQIRRQDLDAFRFNSGMECKTALPELVQCRLSKPG